MKKWERIVDRHIADAIGDGDVSHLPGAGSKLSLKHDSGTPDELRAAFKIMKDHNVTPAWMAAGKRLEQAELALCSQIKTRAQRRLRELQHVSTAAASTNAAKVESNWNRYRKDFLERIDRHNREVLVYNLTLPSGIPHRQTLRGDILIEQALRHKG